MSARLVNTFIHRFNSGYIIKVTEEEHRRIHEDGHTKEENEKYRIEIMRKYRLRVWGDKGLSWQSQPVKVEFT